MVIFLIFLKTKSDQNICQNPPNMTSKTLLRHLKTTYRYCRQRQVVIKMLTICK